jgi:cardiolipin synthase
MVWAKALVITVVICGFYFWYISARIIREPVELDYGPGDPLFLDSMGPLLGAEFTRGNQVRLLANGDAFFPSMLEAIAGAQKSITFESYIWSSGKISDRFIDALVERARHGVKVHVLVDGFGSLRFNDSDQRRLLDGGVQFVMYGREHWYQIKADINHHTHRKLLIVDGRIGFIGGMCVDDTWLGDGQTKGQWRETQLRVEGPVVRQMQAVFIDNWLKTTSRLLVGPEYFPAAATGHFGVPAQCYKSGPHDSPENVRHSYLLAIASAQKTIRLTNAYFVPDDLSLQMLVAARRRGVQVQVLVPAHNDSRFGRAAARSRWGPLLEAGVEIYRYEPAMLHCKLMQVDDYFLTIGSANFDNRSFGINDEVNINVLDRELAREGLRQFEADIARSSRLTLEEFNRRPWWQKAVDHFCGMFRSLL